MNNRYIVWAMFWKKNSSIPPEKERKVPKKKKRKMWRWWRKVPKLAMERLRRWDAEEYARRRNLARIKCERELKKVDWNMMKKHFRTPEALKAYERFCEEARSNTLQRLPGLVYRRCPDPYFQYYYGKFAYLPFHERMRLKWKDGKNLLQERLPQVKMVGLGLAVVGSAFALGSASAAWMLVGTEREKKN